jgi:hypothetical protein
MNRIFDDYLKWIALGLIVYMPLHVFLVQWLSTYTGGLDTWKAAKDIMIVILVPVLIFLSYRRGLFQDKTFRRLMIVGGLYTLLHGLFVLFDQLDDTYSAIVGSVYNTRLLGYLLLGYLVGSARDGARYLKLLLTATVIIASLVALFGIMQYFLPSDLLTHVGYSLERGVKPLFFIDDKPDLPRVMSTLKDPNSLGAYLILPILLTGFATFKEKVNKDTFIRPFRREVLAVMLVMQFIALALTFSRGALLGLGLSIVTLLCIVTGKKLIIHLKKYMLLIFVLLLLLVSSTFLFWDSYTFQNIVFHADESTVLANPNELRVSLTQDAVEDVLESPLGQGPGSAGLVAITNPQGGVLTENYYLQVAYEVGWLGLLLFIAILSTIIYQLSSMARSNTATAVLLASLAGYLFYSLLIHLWSNEAVALQFWLLAGAALPIVNSKERAKSA